MDNQIQIFNFNGAEIREITDENGDPWFVARDICEPLDLNVGSAMQNLDDDEKSKIPSKYLDKPGGHAAPIINESGLYSLILRSRKPEAKAFKKWVTSEVLPVIRKTGQYGTAQLKGPELLAAALIEAHATLERKTKQIEVMKPKADFHDRFLDDRSYYTISSVAKMIRGDVGRNRLKQWMRNNKIIMENGEPYQDHKKHIQIVPEEINGRIYNTPMITPAGVKYILERYLP